MEQTDSSSPSSKASSMESGPNSLTSGSPVTPIPNTNDSPAPPVYPSWPYPLDIYNQQPIPHYYPPVQQQYMPIGFNIPGTHWPDHFLPNPYTAIPSTIEILPVNPYPPAVHHEQKKATFPLKRRHRGPDQIRNYKQPFTDMQRFHLMERFRKGEKISQEERKALGEKIGLTHEQVRTWFANQKAREKTAEKLRKMNMQKMTVDPETRMDHWETYEPGYRVEKIS